MVQPEEKGIRFELTAGSELPEQDMRYLANLIAEYICEGLEAKE